MITILIADDHITVRLGLELLLKELYNDDCSVVHASDGNEVLHHLKNAVFDLLIMDMNMPGPGGLFLLEKVFTFNKHLKVLVISVNPEKFFAPKAISMGAKGFINKNASDKDLKKAIQTITNGDIYWYGPTENHFSQNTFRDNGEANIFNLLSTRELQVILLLLKSKGILEVSNELGISPSATSTLKGRAFKKLCIDSAFELYALARQHCIITDESIRY